MRLLLWREKKRKAGQQAGRKSKRWVWGMLTCDEPAQAADHLDGTLKSTGDEVGKGREEVDDHAEEARDDVGDGAEDAGKQVAEALEEVLDGGGEVRHGCRLLLSLILES